MEDDGENDSNQDIDASMEDMDGADDSDDDDDDEESEEEASSDV